MKRYYTTAIAALAGALFFANPSSAAIVAFGDLEVSGNGTVNSSSNCPFSSASCIHLNQNESLTVGVAGAIEFTLTAIGYSLQGSPAQLQVTDQDGTVLLTSVLQNGNNTDITGTLTGGPFKSLSFFNIGAGTVRIGAFSVEIPDVQPMPVPAGAVLLLTAGGAFAALRRRKTAA